MAMRAVKQTAQVVQASVALGPESGSGLPATSALQVTGQTPLADGASAPRQSAEALCPASRLPGQEVFDNQRGELQCPQPSPHPTMTRELSCFLRELDGPPDILRIWTLGLCFAHASTDCSNSCSWTCREDWEV